MPENERKKSFFRPSSEHVERWSLLPLPRALGLYHLLCLFETLSRLIKIFQFLVVVSALTFFCRSRRFSCVIADKNCIQFRNVLLPLSSAQINTFHAIYLLTWMVFFVKQILDMLLCILYSLRPVFSEASLAACFFCCSSLASLLIGLRQSFLDIYLTQIGTGGPSDVHARWNILQQIKSI